MEIFKLADLNKNNEKYLRRDIDGGILTNKYEIDKYKQEQYINVVDNLMLGNYNEFGEYVIQDDIKKELLNCRKVVEDSYENILFVHSINNVNVFSTLSFAVRILDSSEDAYKTAALELLEPIYKAKGLIENTQASLISKIKVKNDENLKSFVFEKFNIIPKDDASGARKELKDENEFESTLNRKIKLLYIKNRIKEVQQQEDEICFKKNKAELEKTKEGQEVLKNYEKDEKIMQKYLRVDNNDYKSKNELLNTHIEQSKVSNETIATNTMNASKNVIKIIQDAISVVLKKETIIKEKPVKKERIVKERPTKNNNELENVLFNIEKAAEKEREV